MTAPLFLPNSEYLADKWWHRLATVASWIWMIWATGAALLQLWDSSEGFEHALDLSEIIVLIVVWLLSLFVPTVVYRLFLFIYSAFPNSAYLADKWWHRLATVVLWIWAILAFALTIMMLWEFWEGYWYVRETGDDYFFEKDLLILVVSLLSLVVPIVAYRVILFVGTGSTWKRTKGA